MKMKRIRSGVALGMALFAQGAFAADAEPTRLARAFDPEMIGADLPYFEQVVGIPRNTFDDTRIYKVDGCEVTVAVADGVVRSLRIYLDSNCSFNLNRYFPNHGGRFPPPHAMTFGAFDEVAGNYGRFYSDCLTDCGNAYDPAIYAHWIGSRADSSFEVLLESVQASEFSLDAADRWQAEMEAVEGRDWIVAAKFNCTRKYDASAHRAFRDVAITAITVGRDLKVPGCD